MADIERKEDTPKGAGIVIRRKVVWWSWILLLSIPVLLFVVLMSERDWDTDALLLAGLFTLIFCLPFPGLFFLWYFLDSRTYFFADDEGVLCKGPLRTERVEWRDVVSLSVSQCHRLFCLSTVDVYPADRHRLSIPIGWTSFSRTKMRTIPGGAELVELVRRKYKPQNAAEELPAVIERAAEFEVRFASDRFPIKSKVVPVCLVMGSLALVLLAFGYKYIGAQDMFERTLKISPVFLLGLPGMVILRIWWRRAVKAIVFSRDRIRTPSNGREYSWDEVKIKYNGAVARDGVEVAKSRPIMITLSPFRREILIHHDATNYNLLLALLKHREAQTSA